LTGSFEKSHHAELAMGKTVVIEQENKKIFRIDLNPKKWFQAFEPVFCQFVEFMTNTCIACLFLNTIYHVFKHFSMHKDLFPTVSCF